MIYAGSFSKSVFPGMRLGYLVGPRGLHRARRGRCGVLMLRHPPGHIQRTVAYFLSLGHYDALMNRMRAAFRRRRQAMDEAIREHGLTVAGQGGFGGSSFWMRAPEGVDTEALAERLRAEGVLIEPGRAFFAGAGAAELLPAGLFLDRPAEDRRGDCADRAGDALSGSSSVTSSLVAGPLEEMATSDKAGPAGPSGTGNWP